MSIKKLQQLGGERRKGVEPPPKIKPKDFDDLDIDDDDWGDLENDDFEKQPNYNSGGSGSNNRGRGYDAQFDDLRMHQRVMTMNLEHLLALLATTLDRYKE
jgi:hypothetical protein